MDTSPTDPPESLSDDAKSFRGLSNALPPHINQTFYPSLDGFRAFAILAVLISHISYEFGNQEYFLFLGHWGVIFFFVLSGFLITTLLVKETASRGSIALGNFYARRALRIFPAAGVFLAAMAFMNSKFQLGISGRSFLTAAMYIKNLPIAEPGPGWYLAHFWTLAVEEQYYLYAPALLSCGYVVFRRVGFALIGAAILATSVLSHLWPNSVELHYLQRILGPQVSLLIGSLAAILVCTRKFNVPPLGSAASSFLLLIALLVESGQPEFIPYGLRDLLAAMCLSVLVASSIHWNSTCFFKFANQKALRQIGTLSYSLYIWQQIFTHRSFLVSSSIAIPTAIIFNLVLLTLFSSASYFLVERPFLRLKSSFYAPLNFPRKAL